MTIGDLETERNYVLCIGVPLELCSEVARLVGPDAVVVAAADTQAARELLAHERHTGPSGPGGRSPGPGDGRNAEPGDGRGAGPGDGRGAGPGDGRGAGPGDGRSAGPGDGRSAGPGDGRNAGPGGTDGRNAAPSDAVGDLAAARSHRDPERGTGGHAVGDWAHEGADPRANAGHAWAGSGPGWAGADGPPGVGPATFDGRATSDGRPESASRVFTRGPLQVNLATREVTIGGRRVHLSIREFDLLAALASETDRVWSFAELTANVWRTGYLGDSDVVVSTVKRLRRRLLAAEGLEVASVRGIGYRLKIAS